MSGRVSAGQQFVVATAAATARVLQQNGHYLIFAFLHQEGGEIEYPYIPVAGSQRIAGRHGHVVYASQQGQSIILAPARHRGPRFRPSGRVKLRTRADGMIAIYSRSAGRGAR
jgi:hypothetical protein